MTANDPALRRYYRAVRGWLPGSRKLRAQVVTQLRDSVESYLVQEPDASFDMLRKHFGNPQAIAASYVDNADTAELLWTLRIRRRVVTTITAAIAVALILWGGVITYAAVKEYRHNQHTIYITTEEITAHEESQTPDPDALYIVP